MSDKKYVTFTLEQDLVEYIKQHKEKTGVPLSTFINQLIREYKLKEESK